jgi:plastocyanin
MNRTVAARFTAIAAAAGLAGCGGGAGETGAQTSAASGQPSGGGLVNAEDFKFEPSEVSVQPGSEVVWENLGDSTHTVKGDEFFSKAINPGDGWSSVFEEEGTFDYVCTLHPQMTGTVVVEQ